MLEPSSFRKKILMLVCAVGFFSTVLADGLPGEYMLTQRWRDVHAPYSSLSNPAFIAEENYVSGRLAFAPVLGGAFKLWEVGLNYPLSLYHTASFSMLVESDGKVTQDIENDQGGLTPSSVPGLGNSNFVFSVGYAWHLWNQIVVGANLNFAYQSNFSDPLKGTGIDLGATYHLLKHPLIGEHLLGVATQNLIAPTMGHSWVPEWGSTSAYARNLRLSWNSRYWENRVENYMDLCVKDFITTANSFNDDISYLEQIEWDLNWRVGVWAMRMFKAYLMFGFDESVLDYWGLALGANMPAFNLGRDLSAFYQYNIMTEDGNDATTHTFYVKADFGKHREEIFARKMARLASLSPNELYNKARKLYSEKKYWDAFFVFSRIAVEFPDFFKNDWVKLFRADCQEQMDMREQAIQNYNKTKEEFPLSSVVPYADLGLMRIYYRNNDFSAATNQFVELNKPSVPDSLRYHGAYIMGQINLQNGELRKAIHAFSVVPDSHPDYVFAQHGTAIAHAMLDDDMQEVITALENVISAPVTTPEQQEMVNRSYLFLGYIFYEENALSKAVVALRMVPGTSYYAEDALLGQAWTALKARQWNDCISTGLQLSKITTKPVLQCEGLLIQAYGYLLQKDYTKSLAILQTAFDASQKLTIPSVDSLNMRKLQYDDNRLAFSQMSDRVENFSYLGQTSHIAGVLDSMKLQGDVFRTQFNGFEKYKAGFTRSSFFARSTDQVKEDLEYALATIQKIMGVTGDKNQQKIDEKAKDLDQEIQKLKREMEKLESETEETPAPDEQSPY